MDGPVWTETDGGRDGERGERGGVMDSRGSSREREKRREDQITPCNPGPHKPIKYTQTITKIKSSTF